MQQTRNHMTAFTSARRTGWGTLLAGAMLVAAAQAQDQPSPAGSVPAAQPHTTAQQRATAHQNAQHPVPPQKLPAPRPRRPTRRPAAADPDTVRVSPRTRSDSLADVALPTLNPDLVEPFLAE